MDIIIKLSEIAPELLYQYTALKRELEWDTFHIAE